MDDFDGLDETSDERIRPEIQNLIRRGNVPPAELSEIRCNSWEWEALVPVLSDEALMKRMQHALDNCFTTTKRPFRTYNQAIEGLWAPELLRRFKLAISRVEEATANAIRTVTSVDDLYEERDLLRLELDSIREAFELKSMPLFFHRDVKELVEAIESRCDALVVLKRIRGEKP